MPGFAVALQIRSQVAAGDTALRLIITGATAITVRTIETK